MMCARERAERRHSLRRPRAEREATEGGGGALPPLVISQNMLARNGYGESLFCRHRIGGQEARAESSVVLPADRATMAAPITQEQVRGLGTTRSFPRRSSRTSKILWFLLARR